MINDEFSYKIFRTFWEAIYKVVIKAEAVRHNEEHYWMKSKLFRCISKCESKPDKVNHDYILTLPLLNKNAIAEIVGSK